MKSMSYYLGNYVYEQLFTDILHSECRQWENQFFKVTSLWRLMTPTILLIACGALARELVQIVRLNRWQQVRIQCLPPGLHNKPERIPAAVRDLLEKNRGHYQNIFVAYADCGTGGKLDAVLQEFGVERLPGAHCYEFFVGGSDFQAMSEAEAGTFYLTDFLVRHFDRLVRKGLGLDKHPELKDAYFGNYRRVLYLAQSDDQELSDQAKRHAEYLELEYEYHFTGSGRVEQLIQEHIVRWQYCSTLEE